jgi:hypothetical protein
MPANVTDTMLAEPCRMSVPVIVTLAPAAPFAGTTLVMSPAFLYVHAVFLVIVAPVSAVSTTSPADPAADAAATTCTMKSVSRLMVAALPDNVTAATLLPCPRSDEP